MLALYKHNAFFYRRCPGHHGSLRFTLCFKWLNMCILFNYFQIKWPRQWLVSFYLAKKVHFIPTKTRCWVHLFYKHTNQLAKTSWLTYLSQCNSRLKILIYNRKLLFNIKIQPTKISPLYSFVPYCCTFPNGLFVSSSALQPPVSFF